MFGLGVGEEGIGNGEGWVSQFSFSYFLFCSSSARIPRSRQLFSYILYILRDSCLMGRALYLVDTYSAQSRSLLTEL